MAQYGATEQTLLTGDITFGSMISVPNIIRDAGDEMDTKFGIVFVMPLAVSTFPLHIQTMLKLIQSRLASARLLFMAASASEDTTLFEYAKYLEGLAYGDLNLILNGSVSIPGAVQLDGNTATAPKIINTDSESATDVFYGITMAGGSGYWQPGGGS